MSEFWTAECPDCRKRYKVRSSFQGKRFHCKSDGCDGIVEVRLDSSAERTEPHTTTSANVTETPPSRPTTSDSKRKSDDQLDRKSIDEEEVLLFLRHNINSFRECDRLRELLEALERQHSDEGELVSRLQSLDEADKQDAQLRKAVHLAETAHKKARESRNSYAEELGRAAFDSFLQGNLEDRALFEERRVLHREIEDLKKEHMSLAGDASTSLIKRGKLKSRQMYLLAQIKLQERKHKSCHQAIGRTLIQDGSETSVRSPETASLLELIANARTAVQSAADSMGLANQTLAEFRARKANEYGLNESATQNGFSGEISACKSKISALQQSRLQTRRELLMAAQSEKTKLPADIRGGIDELIARIGYKPTIDSARPQAPGGYPHPVLTKLTLAAVGTGFAWPFCFFYTFRVYGTKYSWHVQRGDFPERVFPQSGSELFWTLTACVFLAIASGLGALTKRYWTQAKREIGEAITPSIVLRNLTAAWAPFGEKLASLRTPQNANQSVSDATRQSRLLPLLASWRNKLIAVSPAQVIALLCGVYSIAFLAVWLTDGLSDATLVAVIGALGILLLGLLLRAASGIVARFLGGTAPELTVLEAAQISLAIQLVQLAIGIVLGLVVALFGLSLGTIGTLFYAIGSLALQSYIVSWRLECRLLDGAIIIITTLALSAVLGGIVGGVVVLLMMLLTP